MMNKTKEAKSNKQGPKIPVVLFATMPAASEIKNVKAMNIAKVTAKMRFRSSGGTRSCKKMKVIAGTCRTGAVSTSEISYAHKPASLPPIKSAITDTEPTHPVRSHACLLWMRSLKQPNQGVKIIIMTPDIASKIALFLDMLFPQASAFKVGIIIIVPTLLAVRKQPDATNLIKSGREQNNASPLLNDDMTVAEAQNNV